MLKLDHDFYRDFKPEVGSQLYDACAAICEQRKREAELQAMRAERSAEMSRVRDAADPTLDSDVEQVAMARMAVPVVLQIIGMIMDRIDYSREQVRQNEQQLGKFRRDVGELRERINERLHRCSTIKNHELEEYQAAARGVRATAAELNALARQKIGRNLIEVKNDEVERPLPEAAPETLIIDIAANFV